MASNTIMIRGAENARRLERVAAAAITPGQLLELTSADKVQRHSTGGGRHFRLVAVEDELQGKEISEDYAADARVQFNVVQPGDEINALIADGEDIAIGDQLESNGDGDLRECSGDSGQSAEDSFFGVALEAIDLSDSSGADPSSRRCRVLVL